MKRLNLDIDNTLSTDSNILASSQKAIKSYADTKLKNTATGTDSLTIDGTSNTNNQGVNIGKSSVSNTNGTAIGVSSESSSSATAIGYNAKATASSAIQIGTGTNNTADTFQVKTFPVLNSSGNIVSDRIPFATANDKGGIKVEFDSSTGTLNIITE